MRITRLKMVNLISILILLLIKVHALNCQINQKELESHGCIKAGSLACLNNGVCLSTGFCECKPGYVGSTCAECEYLLFI